MSHYSRYPDDSTLPLNRRELLGRCGMGFGLIGLARIMADDNLLGSSSSASAASPNSTPLRRKRSKSSTCS
jgi:hypothetical protein